MNTRDLIQPSRFQDAVSMFEFLGTAFVIALLAWWVLGKRSVPRPIEFGLVSLVGLAPFWISEADVHRRALACFIAGELWFKILDYLRRRRSGSLPEGCLRSYLSFLIPFPVLLVRFGSAKRNRASWMGWQSTLVAWSLVILGFAAAHQLQSVEQLQNSFWLDHTIKLLLFVGVIESISRGLHGIERMLGYTNDPLMNRIFLSESVGDFWTRYNTRVHDWFRYNVFRPSGGIRTPVRGIVATFFVSAVLHELMFAVATSRLDGYQFAFFVLQIPMVVISRRKPTHPRRERLWAWGSRAIAWGWMWWTSMFFFHGVNRVFPVYYAADPWLP